MTITSASAYFALDAGDELGGGLKAVLMFHPDVFTSSGTQAEPSRKKAL